MDISILGLDFKKMNTPFPLLRAKVSSQEWRETSLAIAELHGRLVTLWATQTSTNRFLVSVVFSAGDLGLILLELPLNSHTETYPELSSLFPCAKRMQRTVWDLMGIRANGAEDNRPWLNHGTWPENYFPLLKNNSGDEMVADPQNDEYPFVQVEGEGVHEIAVGPVHAGVIEPGHFRFSVVGEKTLRLEERLGYAHKGVDKKFEEFSASEGHRLAGRISGDSTVSYAWAYCMAVESAWGWKVPARALWLRALLLERERIANHLGDLGSLGNDAGFGFGLTQFMRLKEDWLRVSKDIFNHRFMMDCILPGGVNIDIEDEDCQVLLNQCQFVQEQVQILRGIYDDHAGLQDRFLFAGTVSLDVALELGLTGLAGRASGVLEDARVIGATCPYTEIEVNIAGSTRGDVAARVSVRFEEIFESIRLIRKIIEKLPNGNIFVAGNGIQPKAFGAGWVEGWRGGIFVAVNTSKGGKIERCHVHDPSWQNWPVLEFAVIGDIVPDFPLINKSFNLTYSGHDR